MPTTDDVRMRLLDEVRSGLSVREAAARIGVHLGSAKRWAKEAKLEVEAPKPQTDSKSKASVPDAIVRGASREDVADAKPAKKPRKNEAERRAEYERRLYELRQAHQAKSEAVVAAVAKGLSVEAAAAQVGVDVRAAARMVKLANFERQRPEFERQVLAAVESGLSVRQAAAQVGVGIGAATRWVKAAGVKHRTRPARHAPEKRDAVLRAVADGLSLKHAAAIAGVSVFLARQWAYGGRKTD